MNLKAVYTKQYEGCVFFDSALAAASYRRLIHNASVIHVHEPSFRSALKHGKTKPPENEA